MTTSGVVHRYTLIVVFGKTVLLPLSPECIFLKNEYGHSTQLVELYRMSYRGAKSGGTATAGQNYTMRRVDWGWQGRTKKLRLRAEHLLKNMTVASDITFVLQSKSGTVEHLHAHKIFLAIGSEVFQAMIYGPVADVNDVHITIPNYSKDVFNVLVTFLYTDRAEGLRMENAMEVLECAQQYGVPELAALCRSFVCGKLEDNLEMVLPMLIKARTLDEPEIEKFAMKVLDYYALDILSRNSITELERDFLQEILQRSQLKLGNANEINVYRAAHRWAQKRVDNFVSPDENQCSELRHLLGPVFSHIRFPLMTYSQIAEGPVKDRMFTFKELTEVYRYQFQRDNGALVGSAFPSMPRKSKPLQEIAEVTFRAIKAERECRSCGETLDDVADFSTEIVMDEACPETSGRFKQLCRGGYHFSINFRDVEFRNSGLTEDGEELSQPDLSAELLLPLPVNENSLMHDSFGTVALRRSVISDGSVTYTLDVCGDGRNIRVDDNAVVFGRLKGWRNDAELLKVMRKMAKSGDLNADSAMLPHLLFEVDINLTLHQPYLYL